jgi:hypothetical protein
MDGGGAQPEPRRHLLLAVTLGQAGERLAKPGRQGGRTRLADAGQRPADQWAQLGVVKAVLGTDDIPEIAVTSPTAPGVTHRWTNIMAFTEEVANARIWAGFHYRFSTRVGRDMGLKIGEYVAKSVMQPVSR